MEAKLTFLGTGSSMGVPVIGCKCAVCYSTNLKNRRSRAGALIEVGTRKFLIDAGPDLRQQVLSRKMDAIDGFILTHAHNDHIAGLDDLKVFKYRMDRKIPSFMLKETFDELKLKYHYFIRPTEADPHQSPYFDWHLVESASGQTLFQEMNLRYVSYSQSGMRVLGVKIGDMAYISDIKEYSPDIFTSLKGTKVLVVSALQEAGSPMHFSIDDAIDFSRKVGASLTYLTHISHRVDHEKTQQELPDGVFLAYDGLSFSFQMDRAI